MKKNNDRNRFYAEIWPQMATVLRTATFLTSRPADAEDLAQETMLKAFGALDSLKPATNTRAWLLTILRHVHVDRFRSRHKEASLEQLEQEPADASKWEPQERVEAWDNPESVLNELSDQDMIDALRELPKEIRWTLLLCDIESIDEADAATILSVPVGTVKSRLHRGRQMLRTLLAPIARQLRWPVTNISQTSVSAATASAPA